MAGPLLRLGIVAVALALSACRAGSTESAAASPSTAEASPSPSASAEPSLGPPADASPNEASRPVFPKGVMATVRVQSLRVRSDASISAPVLDDPFNEYATDGKVVLQPGDHVLVLSDATWADGYWWLQVAVDRIESPVHVGYMAAGTAADPWVEADNSFCPMADPSVLELSGLSGVERLGCFPTGTLGFLAFRATEPPDGGLGGACDPAGMPEWLVCDNINYSWVNHDGGTAWELLLHFDPATGIPETGLAKVGSPNPQLQITGHFDDPAAVGCAPNPPTTLEEWGAYITCRTLFVVDQLN